MTVNSLEGNDLYEFGPFRLDLRARLLSKGAETASRSPRSRFDVLSYLVRHAGRAVSREELLAAVWPDVVVSDGSLTQAVFVVRRALGEREDAPGFLATVPRVGYRFSDGRARGSAARSAGGRRPVSGGGPRPPAGRGDEPAPADASGAEPSVSSSSRAPSSRCAGRAGALGATPRAPARAFSRWCARLRRRRTRRLSSARPAARRCSARRRRPTSSRSTVRRPRRASRSRAGEVVANRLVGSELVVAAGRDILARDVLTQKARALGRLPGRGVAGAPRERSSSRPPVAPSRLRGPDAIVVLAVRRVRPRRLFRVAARETSNEALALSDRWLAFAAGNGEPLRVFDAATGARAARDARSRRRA